MPDDVVNIKADTPEDFVDQAHAAIGDGDALGHTDFDLSDTKWKTKDGKVTSAELKVTTSVRRATWTGPATTGKKLSKDDAKTQADLNKLIPDHEQKHVKLAKDIVAKAKAKFQKDVVGKTEDEAQELLDAIKKQIDDAYKKLDAKEGGVTVTKGSNGVSTVKVGGV
jgi:hypothetical protein